MLNSLEKRLPDSHMEKIGCRGVMAFAAIASLLLPPPRQSSGVAATSVAVTVTGLGSNYTRSCGNISIPYPFGVEPGCYHATGFNLSCHQQENPPTLFLGDGTVQVLDISVPNATVRINSIRVDLSFDGRNTTVNGTWGAGLPQGGNYFLAVDSSTNKMVVVGCSVQVNLQGGEDSSFVSSCSTICPTIYPGTAGSGSRNQHSKLIWTSGDCSGLHCSQANIPQGYSFYRLHGSSYDGNNKVSAYVTDSVYSSSRNKFGMTIFPEALPATLDWVINESECPANGSAPECLSANSSCQGSVSSIGFGVRSRGYVCSCSYGYQGNPCIPGGCQGT